MKNRFKKYSFTIIEVVIASTISIVIMAAIIFSFYLVSRQIVTTFFSTQTIKHTLVSLDDICRDISYSNAITLFDNYILKKEIPCYINNQKSSFVVFQSPVTVKTSAYYFDISSENLFFIDEYKGILNPDKDKIIAEHCKEFSIKKIKDNNVYQIILEVAITRQEDKTPIRLVRIINLKNIL